MVVRSVRGFIAVAVLALGLTGCAMETRVARFGPLPDGASLVTLVVSEDLEVVRRECAEVRAEGRILGCQVSRPVRTSSGPLPVRAMKIVRYADTMPSATTFEIDAHELCHAIAALQFLDDPCHEGNNGVLQAGDSPLTSIR